MRLLSFESYATGGDSAELKDWALRFVLLAPLFSELVSQAVWQGSLVKPYDRGRSRWVFSFFVGGPFLRDPAFLALPSGRIALVAGHPRIAVACHHLFVDELRRGSHHRFADCAFALFALCYFLVTCPSFREEFRGSVAAAKRKKACSLLSNYKRAGKAQRGLAPGAGGA